MSGSISCVIRWRGGWGSSSMVETPLFRALPTSTGLRPFRVYLSGRTEFLLQPARGTARARALSSWMLFCELGQWHTT